MQKMQIAHSAPSELKISKTKQKRLENNPVLKSAALGRFYVYT